MRGKARFCHFVRADIIKPPIFADTKTNRQERAVFFMSGRGLLTLRAFALAFAASFLLLSGGAALAVWQLTKPAAPSAEPSQPSASGVYIPREEDVLTVMLIGSDAAGAAPSHFTMLRLNVLAGDIPVFSFPAETAFEHEGVRSTAQSIAAEHGPEALCAAVGSGLGIKIDRWVVWDAEGCSAAVNRMGPFDFALSSDLFYTDGFRQISLSKGIQRVDGKKFVDMVTFPAFTSEMQRCDIASKLLSALLESRIYRLTDDALAAGVLNLTQTNITAEDRNALAPAMKFNAGLPYTISYHVTCETRYNSVGQLIFNDSARARVKKYFK